MSGYKYGATEEERQAEALLREKGWSVREPSCPLCLGRGFAFNWEWGFGQVSTSTYSTKPCPNGCQLSMYFADATTAANA